MLRAVIGGCPMLHTPEVAMRRPKLIAAAIVVALATAGSFALRRPTTTPRLTQGNFDRIQPGMSRSTVESILGPPEYVQGGGIRFPPLPSQETCSWTIGGIAVHVSFDTSGNVNDKLPEQFKIRSGGQLDRILQRLKGQLRELFP
jgi:hypothetical protein